MSDEEYNRIFGSIPKPTFSLLFLICIAVVCLLFWSIAASADDGTIAVPYTPPTPLTIPPKSITIPANEDCGVACTGTAWELEINGDVVARGLTEQECDDLAQEIEPQTPPFRQMVCREYEIAEQKI